MAKRKAKRRPVLPPAPKPAHIRAMRESLGLSIEDAAAKIGVTARAWLAWELPSQKRAPRGSHLILLRMLDCGEIK